jgi:hypothetical protein
VKPVSEICTKFAKNIFKKVLFISPNPLQLTCQNELFGGICSE